MIVRDIGVGLWLTKSHWTALVMTTLNLAKLERDGALQVSGERRMPCSLHTSYQDSSWPCYWIKMGVEEDSSFVVCQFNT